MKPHIGLMGGFIATFAILVGLLAYPRVFPYKIMKAFSAGGIEYDNRAVKQRTFGIKEFKERQGSDINELEIIMNFKVFAIDGPTDLFQTARLNQGMNLQLSRPSVLNLIAGTNLAPGYKSYILSTTLELNKWHVFYLKVSPTRRIIIRLDDNTVVDAPDTELTNGISDIEIGGGLNGRLHFDGEIRDLFIAYNLYRPNVLASSSLMRTLEILFLVANLIFLFSLGKPRTA